MEGRLVLDRFRLAEELGRGAFGTVHRARDVRLQRDVAVKVLANGPGSHRVLREAQAAARLNHPSIVTLYELGEDAGSIYLVSELVDGETLRALIRHGRISDRDLAEAGADVCEALAHAHERGVVHRDVKPENIAVARWEDARIGPWSAAAASGAMLMDFGVASVAGAAALTRTGEVVGTLAYMAPEQAEGEPAGPEADVYSLALVLYEGFSGHNPVTRATPAATARAIGAPITPLAERRPDLPAALAATIDACLEPYPEVRPHATELGAELTGASGELDSSRSVPAPGDDGRRRRLGMRRPLIRLGALAALVSIVAWLATAGGEAGLATVIAALCVPLPLLFDRVRDWLAPAAAPFLGLLGLAPVYPALAGLAGTPRRAAALGLLGWCWLAVAEALMGETLLLGTVDAPAPGWEQSASLAATDVLLPLLAPASLAGAATWTVGAALLASLLASRSAVIRAVGALGWGAGLVAMHRLLVGTGSDPATAGLVAALAVILAVAVWVRSVGGAPTRISAPANGLHRALAHALAGARARPPATSESTTGHLR
ncbi:MAG TPA: serine/threonine-protein kinase [Solirubrobacterales bacterium]